ncbi:hypothetical protein ACTXT7_017647 [Hymenolepis weldensis]
MHPSSRCEPLSFYCCGFAGTTGGSVGPGKSTRCVRVRSFTQAPNPSLRFYTRAMSLPAPASLQPLCSLCKPGFLPPVHFPLPTAANRDGQPGLTKPEASEAWSPLRGVGSRTLA